MVTWLFVFHDCFLTPQYSSFNGVATTTSNAEPSSGRRTLFSSHTSVAWREEVIGMWVGVVRGVYTRNCCT